MSEPDALAILKAGRARIVIPGAWGKGRRNHDRPLQTCCALEAIEEASPDFACRSERIRAYRALYYAAGLDWPRGAFIGWHDAPERTHTDVIRVYDLAIATLRLG